MPGVLRSNFLFGLNREVGKMANNIDPSLLSMDFNDPSLEDIANKVLGNCSSSLPGNFLDADLDLDLPDNETPMDLLKFLENDEGTLDLDNLTCDAECSNNSRNNTDSQYDKYRSSQQDPFMGMGNQESNSPTAKNSLLSQMMSPLDYDYDQQMQQQKEKTQSFVAWGHRSLPIKEEKDEDDFDLEEYTKTTISQLVQDEDDLDTMAVTFLDTPSPSSQSGTATGDDSDVDIETITEAPRVADSCGYVTLDSTPSSPASSSSSNQRCANNGGLISILSRSGPASPPSSATSSACSSPRRSPTIHFSTYGVSSSASLAENLMKGRTSLLGQKRKLAKEKRAHRHHQLEQRVSSSSSQASYQHVLCTSNSINFHDYAMSPLSPDSSPNTPFSPSLSSTETGQPTVNQTKRVYKRKQLPLDATDKEKQHHHNQLERNRRQKLADLFIDLRDEVPSISCQSKASKVMILKEATDYITELQSLESSQADTIASELRRKEALTKQLRHLRSQLGMGRVS